MPEAGANRNRAMREDVRFSIERASAESCRRFHDRVLATTGKRNRRESLARFAVTFYETRLHLSLDANQRAAFDALADEASLAIEMAHDGQLPHLGIVRLVLKAHDIATIDGRAITLYLVGNHYSPAMRPHNVRFGMPLNGESSDALKHPPRIRIGRANAHVPFRWLPPPKSEDLVALRSRVADFAANNLAHERKLGNAPIPEAEDRIRSRLASLFDLFERAAREVSSLGDWLIRVQHDLFHRMAGAEACRILFLPMADIVDLFQEDLAEIARAGEADPAMKALLGGVAAHGEGIPASPFWVYCPSCHRRSRTTWSPGAPVDFTCPTCGHHALLGEAEAWHWIMPDIVAYELGLFRLGIDGWVVGSHAAYHPAIERAYDAIFRTDMPPKFFLTSVPTFRGAGDPRDGYARTRLARAMLEMEPVAIADALRAPWAENPRLLSDVLARP